MKVWTAIGASTLMLIGAGCTGPQVVSEAPLSSEAPVGSEAPVSAEGSAEEVRCPAGSAMRIRAGVGSLVSVSEAFEGAKDGDQIDLCPGRALHDAPFVLSGVTGVRISGQKSALVATGDFPVVQIKRSSEVVLEGVRVVHEVGEWCAHGCVEIYDSKKVTVRDSELDGSGYFGIIATSVTESSFLGNVFHNCHFGFSTFGATAITLKDNTFRDNRGANLSLNAETSFTNDIEADNTFGPLAPKTKAP